MQSKAIVAATSVLLLASTAACSELTQPTPTVTVTVSPAVPSHTQPRNPVDILKQIPNCELEEGVVLGETDVYGNRYAKCRISDNGQGGHEINVRTYPGDPKVLDTRNVQYWARNDSRATIIGDDFVLTVSAFYMGDKLKIDPAEIQKIVGGEIQP